MTCTTCIYSHILQHILSSLSLSLFLILQPSSFSTTSTFSTSSLHPPLFGSPTRLRNPRQHPRPRRATATHPSRHHHPSRRPCSATVRIGVKRARCARTLAAYFIYLVLFFFFLLYKLYKTQDVDIYFVSLFCLLVALSFVFLFCRSLCVVHKYVA